MTAPSPTIIEGLPIERILFVQKMERQEKGFRFEMDGLPGHCLNAVVAGRLDLEINGRRHLLKRGDVMWYHEAEHAKGVVVEAPWEYYTINFLAPALPPPGFEHRNIRLGAGRYESTCRSLLDAWRNTTAPHVVRVMRVQSLLLALLSRLITPAQQEIRFGNETSLWWQIETEVRKDLRRPIDMRVLCQMAKRSRITIIRSCQRAVGMPPLKRIKQMRLSMAHGLVILSRLTITEIADRVGYARVHELSRDYHKAYGATPTEHREQYPRIYEREFGLPLKTGE